MSRPSSLAQPSRRLFLLSSLAAAAHAATRRRSVAPHSTLIADATGNIVHGKNEESRWPPASTAKLMTIYLALEHLGLDTKLEVSDHAAAQPTTHLGLRTGSIITVREALQGMIVHSANDAAVALAEEVSGSEPLFIEQMNEKARTLGMLHTRFCTASGLPAPDQLTTAHDMALLMNAIRRDFPEHQDLFRIPDFLFNGVKYRRSDGDIMYPGLKYRGIQNVVIEADKTGYTKNSHYNIVASASHAGQRIVVVVMGAPTPALRRAAFQRLIETGFSALAV